MVAIIAAHREADANLCVCDTDDAVVREHSIQNRYRGWVCSVFRNRGKSLLHQCASRGYLSRRERTGAVRCGRRASTATSTLGRAGQIKIQV